MKQSTSALIRGCLPVVAASGAVRLFAAASALSAAVISPAWSVEKEVISQAPSARALAFERKAEWAIRNDPNLKYSPSTILVQFDPSAPPYRRDSLRKLVDGERIASVRLVPGLEVVGTSLPPEWAVRILSRQPGVLIAELDPVLRITDTIPNDPLLPAMWGLLNNGQTGGLSGADIRATKAWDIFTGNPNFVVADVDTGIQLDHPDLAANIWTNPGEIPNNNKDDDGNGFKDDVHGWDFVNNKKDPIDDNGHGTHTAGTIGAVGNNGIGVAGVNWSVKIMPLKTFNENGYGTGSHMMQALDYAVAMGARVSNNSWGSAPYPNNYKNAWPSLRKTIENARAAGHLVVAAAANSALDADLTPQFPAAYDLDNIISVAAMDHNDNLAWFSNYGLTSVDLGAPGVAVLSTRPGGNYTYGYGTSMATPHVTGVAALVWGLHPDWTYSQVRDAILNTTRPVPALAGKTVTGGVLDAFAAILYVP